MKRIKAIFIPGNGGASVKDKGGFFPYVKRELEKLRVKVISQDFPDPELARAKYWLPFIKKLGAYEETFLIGHSSGAEAALRYTEENKILGSVLVGACYTDLGMETEKLSGYYTKKWNWDKIRKNQNWIIQFHSLDDPWIPIKEARFVHQKLGTEYFEFSDQGHFGGDRDYPKFPKLVEEIKKKIK